MADKSGEIERSKPLEVAFSLPQYLTPELLLSLPFLFPLSPRPYSLISGSTGKQGEIRLFDRCEWGLLFKVPINAIIIIVQDDQGEFLI